MAGITNNYGFSDICSMASNKILIINKWFDKTPWKIKLPLVVSLGLIIVFLPMILGLAEPSPLGKDDFYSNLCLLIFVPTVPILVPLHANDLIKYVEKTSNLLSELLFLCLILAVYIFVSYLIGIIMDIRKRKSKAG